MDRESVDAWLSSSGRRKWTYAMAMAFCSQALMSPCLADRTVRITCVPRCYAFVSLQMSSLRQGNKRSRSFSFKQLSSLSSKPFPAADGATRRKTKRQTHHHQHSATSWSNNDVFMSDDYQEEEDDNSNTMEAPFARQSIFTTMPSPLFTNLAHSQFELLSNSLVHTTAAPVTTDNQEKSNNRNDIIQPGTPKISSMVIYLPQKNHNTSQLEFVPAVTYPNPSSDRVFIASESSSNSDGIPQHPMVPPSRFLGELPGFFKARNLIPSYSFASSSSEVTEDDGMFTTVSPDSSISVSVVEDVSSPHASPTTFLSITLLSGMDTLGVLMIWPSTYSSDNESQNQWKWTSNDKLQVTRAAKSLALALSMDNERALTQLANEQFCVAMSDSLHQVKSPLQALRTFGNLLQRQLAEENADEGRKGRPVIKRIPMTAQRQQRHALKLAEDLMSQGERVIGLIEPMDALVQNGGRYLLRWDIKEPASSTLILQPLNAVVPNGSNQSSNAIAVYQQQQYELPPALSILGDFELEMVFPQDILGSMVYASQAISREKGINFDVIGFEPDNLYLPGVTVCQKHLKEAVSNLLDNAIKYAPCRRKGKVGRPRIPQIKVSLVSNEPQLSPGATLYIEDNGPGIPTSERDKVFERGYRSETVHDTVAGSGLGLAIAREMISRMGGMIDVLEGEGPSKLDGTTSRIILFRDQE